MRQEYDVQSEYSNIFSLWIKKTLKITVDFENWVHISEHFRKFMAMLNALRKAVTCSPILLCRGCGCSSGGSLRFLFLGFLKSKDKWVEIMKHRVTIIQLHFV